MTYAEYQAALEALQQDYLTNISNLELKALNFQLDTIMQQYSEEIDTFYQILNEATDKWTDEVYMQSWEDTPVVKIDMIVQDVLEDSGLDDTTKKEIETLLENMQPTIEQMEELKAQYAELGIELSDEMATAFAKVDLLGAMTARRGFGGIGFEGDIQAANNTVGALIANNEEYSEVKDILEGYGWELPTTFAENITAASQEAVPPAVDGMYAYTQETIDEYYAQGFTADADVYVSLNPINDLVFNSGLSKIGNAGLAINQRANGGLATRPELTWFAEKGPEMAIPIDGSQNAISLWEQTGRLLGMDSVLDGLTLDGGGGTPTIEYSPTLQFYGEAPSKEDLTDALMVSQDEFDQLMDRYFKTHGRVSFS